MNKTPQEQAEAMAWKLARAQHEALRLSESQMINTNGHGIDYLVWDNCRVPLVETLQQEIPLPELIAVARAAASDKKDEECTCGTDPERSCRYCGYFIRLDRALQALRATGKVEL